MTRLAACPELNNYEQIARLLAQELPKLPLGSEPLDVVDSLENLSEDMAFMPEIIKDCRLATEVFDELDQVIGHMYALADRAVDLPENRKAERLVLDGEFKGYAHIVARLAGAEDFDGPSLSLATRPEALAARRILGYLGEAREGFTRRLADQRRHINQAMDEAVGLLVRLVSETEELSHQGRGRLRELLDRLAAQTGLPEAPAGPASGPWLH
jgi:hypothetical protein